MHKRAFTLFEVILVAAIILLTLGGLGFSIRQAFDTEDFESSVHKIVAQTKLAQEIMLDYRHDVTMLFKESEEGVWTCQLQVAAPLPPRIQKRVEKALLLKGVEQVLFENESADELYLHFESALGETPLGELTLIHSQTKQESLHFQGYPAPIFKHNTVQENEKTPYPQEIFSLT